MTESPQLDAACLYTGRVRHRRFTPKPHHFSYSLYMSYLELGRIDEVLDQVAFASSRGPAWVRFRRDDYFGDAAKSLEQEVRDLVAARAGVRPAGPIRMLTHLRSWGLSFNPVSFFYCFDEAGSRVEHVVAEINNTPWDERYTYVLSEPEKDRELAPHEDSSRPQRPQRVLTYRTSKDFHVSPFIDMDVRYRWVFSEPGERLLVHMEDHPQRAEAGGKIFDATLSLDRRLPFTTRELLGRQLRHPVMPAMVVLWIYRQALSLWLKKIPFFSHPKKRPPVVDPSKGPIL